MKLKIWRFLKFSFFFLAIASLLLGLGTYLFTYVPIDLAPYQLKNDSLRIYDRHGILLREVLTEKGDRSSFQKLDQMNPFVPSAFLALEDRRFFEHSGIDFHGVARAFFENLKARRIVSGGSSLTQQLVELTGGKRNRSFSSKFVEMIDAVRLERSLKKTEILELYINRAPFGNLTRGIESASKLYFGKSSRLLSLAEAAMLASIPNQPSKNNPFYDLPRAKAGMKKVLRRMLGEGMISETEYQLALAEEIRLAPKEKAFNAPHFTSFVMQKAKQLGLRGDLKTSLSLPLQEQVEYAVLDVLSGLKDRNVHHASVVILDNKTGEILAYVGSPDFYEKDVGQFDMVQGLRQPGSALKPFLYGLALQNGFKTTDLLPDFPQSIPTDSHGGFYHPQNYDRTFHGLVPFNQSLACSYNLPAIWLSYQIGIHKFHQMLLDFGFEHLQKPTEFYGYGLTLGAGEVTLLEIANAYRTLANEGRASPVRWIQSTEAPVFEQKISPQIALELTQILSDPIAREPSFGRNGPLETPFPSAVKTGTSNNYRDNWTVGYTKSFTAACWAGNFDHTPMAQISGVTGAGPIWRQAITLANDGRMEHFKEPLPDFPDDFPKENETLPKASVDSSLQNPTIPSAVDHPANQKTAIPSEVDDPSVHRTDPSADSDHPSAQESKASGAIQAQIEENSLAPEPPDQNQSPKAEPAQALKDFYDQLVILFPEPNSRIALRTDRPLRYSKIKFKVSAPESDFPLLFELDDQILEGEGLFRWWIPTKGHHHLKVSSGTDPNRVKEVFFNVYSSENPSESDGF